jgi:hypothetical protein
MDVYVHCSEAILRKQDSGSKGCWSQIGLVWISPRGGEVSW